MFGQISGVAVDDSGRVYVTDRQAHEVRVFDSGGTFLFAMGGQGAGPGELDRPCCPAFGPEGDLWVRDDQNRRYNRYRVGAEDARSAGQISMDHSFFGRMASTTFDEEGRLIDVGGKQGEELGDSRTVRMHRTVDNETAREQLIPKAPDDRVHIYEADVEGGMVVFIPQPWGPEAQDAHAPNGDWAFAITDRYEVVRFDAEGDTLHVLERDVQGPELSGEERKRAKESLQQRVENFDATVGELPFGVPDRKPPIDDIFFDANSRLWVKRSTPDGAPNEADVYSQDGALVEVVQWPRGISLERGVVQDSMAYGVRSGGSTIPQVVRLRY